MKKIFLVCLLVLSFLGCTTVFAGNNVTQGNSGITGKKSYEVLNPEGYEGYWAEKASACFCCQQSERAGKKAP